MPHTIESIKDKLFENIFNHAHNGIAIVGLDGKWVKVNKSVLDLLGYTEEELYRITFQDITHKDDLEKGLKVARQLLEGNIPSYQIEKRYFNKKGNVVWVLLSVSLEFDTNRKPKFFIAQMVDISLRKRISWQMEAISKIMKEQNEKLMDFAHIATHDISTHVGNLNTIISFIEEDLNETDYEENFNMLKEALLQLENTVSHLNEVRQEEFSPYQNLKPLNLNKFVEYAIYNVSAIAKHEQCEIINSVDRFVEVMGLEAYMDSIILNFLTNAIKYSSKERDSFIKINSYLDGECVVLEIQDNGLGMDLAKYGNRLFKFKQTFHEHDEAHGIGLFITKNHVESLGGRIEVESQVNVGSRFKIYFKKV